MSRVEDFIKHVNRSYGDPRPDELMIINPTLVKIYARLMNEQDAEIAIHVSPMPETAAYLAEKINRPVEEVAPVLAKLADNGAIFMIYADEPMYCLAPYAPGTLEFLIRKDILDDEMAKLIDDHWKETALDIFPYLPKGGMRVVPVQQAIEAEPARLSYEEVEKYIDESPDVSCADCLCRIMKRKLGEGCGHPIEDMCIQVGPWADYFVRTGRGRRITKEEAKSILRRAGEAGLVHEAFITEEGSPFICNCCSCCCLGLRALSEIKAPHGILKANYIAQVDSEKCVACGACVEKCQFNALRLGDAICRSTEKQEASSVGKIGFDPNYRVRTIVDENGTSPCKTECPAHISVQGYIKLASQGKYNEALELIKKDNPFPAVCGRVCHHPCEAACTRCDVDEAVAIDPIKRFIADRELNAKSRYIPGIKVKREEKAAVIGAGPAGLACAYYLAAEGYKVTVFEKQPTLGGMLTMGLPSFRLGRDVINAEIEAIRDLGVAFKTGVEIGKDTTIAQLREQGYKAFFLAVGAQVCRSMKIEGEDLTGVIPALDFLRDVNLGRKVSLGDRVAVIGGGNVAMDAVRAALRTGSKKPFLIYRRSEAEMPANSEEIEECREEGIEIITLANPVRILGEQGRVKALECVRMKLGEPDASGRPRPEPITGSEFSIVVDAVIPAIGQQTDWACLTPECSCRLTGFGTMEVDPMTLQSAAPDIFAGGDAVTGPKSIIEAIAAGKQAAISMHRYIQGDNLKLGREREFRSIRNIETDRYEHMARQKMGKTAPEIRIKNFSEVQIGFTEEQLRKETERCLGCGTAVLDPDKCVGCGVCTVQCRFDAIKLAPKEVKVHPPKDAAAFAQEIRDYTEALKKAMS